MFPFLWEIQIHNFQFLPIYQESEKFLSFPLSLSANCCIYPACCYYLIVRTEQYLAQYACASDLISVYHSLPDAGTSY